MKNKLFFNYFKRRGTIALTCSQKLSVLSRGRTSKHHGDFYWLNCFHSFAKENKLELHKKACENKGFCNGNMPPDDTKALEFNQYQKSDKVPFIVHADLEYIIEKIDGWKYNPKNSCTTKLSKDIPTGFQFYNIFV